METVWQRNTGTYNCIRSSTKYTTFNEYRQINLLIVDCLLGKGFGCVWRDDMVEGFYLCGLLQHYWAKGRGNGHFGMLKKVLLIN